MPAPYSKSFEIEVTGGVEEHVALSFPHRGTIKQVRMVQVEGTEEGFDFDLYNSRQPMENAEGESESDAGSFVDPRTCQIIPTQDTAGDSVVIDSPNGYPYCNADGSISVPEKFVYLRLSADGTGAKTFQLSLTMIPAC